jgi:hypothetical protein
MPCVSFVVSELHRRAGRRWNQRYWLAQLGGESTQRSTAMILGTAKVQQNNFNNPDGDGKFRWDQASTSLRAPHPTDWMLEAALRFSADRGGTSDGRTDILRANGS